jgi:hypothetical protein
MTPEEDQEERGEIIRRAQDEDRQADASLAKVQAQLEQAQARKRETEAKRLRAEAAADDPSFETEFCRDCFVELGERVPMTPQSGGYAEDVYRCRNGHEHRVRRR